MLLIKKQVCNQSSAVARNVLMKSRLLSHVIFFLLQEMAENYVKQCLKIVLRPSKDNITTIAPQFSPISKFERGQKSIQKVFIYENVRI